MRDSLASQFGCDSAALASVPDGTLVQQYTASEGAGEDIAGFYNRIHSAYPSIGGNVMGQNPESNSTDSSVDSNDDNNENDDD